jgi:multidrug efflux system membrane fusion protein
MRSTYQIIAAATIGVSAVLTGCGRQQQAATPQQPPPGVVVVEAKAVDVPLYLDEIGKATALEAVTITPRIAGQIISKQFEDGAEIKKGQVLFQIDPAPSQAALAVAQAEVARAKAAAEFAQNELNRYTAVAGTQAISKSDLDTKRNAVDVAKDQVASAEASVRTAQINLDFCTISSPIDGRAGSRMVDVGNVVKENETALLSIQKLDPIYADFTVNERDLSSVRQNMADGALKTFVRVPGEEGEGREGQLTFLDNSVQAASGTVRLRATLKNTDGHFWPGQLVNVRLVLKTLKDAVLVPKLATQVSQQGLFVFRVDESDKSPTKSAVSQQIVQTGQQQGEMVVISSGLKAGEKVVVSGQMLLQPGSPVTIVSGPGAAPPPQPQQGAADASKEQKGNG